MRIEIIIAGINPLPWTAPEGSIGRGRGKGLYIQYHKSAALDAYQEAIRECVKEAYPDCPMFEKDLYLRGDFYLFRQLETGTDGKGKKHKSHIADRTNLLKSTEDALQGVLYHNDQMIIEGETKLVQLEDIDPLIVVHLTDELNASQRFPQRKLPDGAPSPPGNVFMSWQI